MLVWLWLQARLLHTCGGPGFELTPASGPTVNLILSNVYGSYVNAVDSYDHNGNDDHCHPVDCAETVTKTIVR